MNSESLILILECFLVPLIVLSFTTRSKAKEEDFSLGIILLCAVGLGAIICQVVVVFGL